MPHASQYTRAAAGPGRSEHWNVHTLVPLARKRESPTGPHVPCERRTVPAEPHPQRNPLIPKTTNLWRENSELAPYPAAP